MRRLFFIALIFCWVAADLAPALAASPWFVETTSLELLEEIDPKAKEERTVAVRQSFVAALPTPAARPTVPVSSYSLPHRPQIFRPGLHIVHRTLLL